MLLRYWQLFVISWQAGLAYPLSFGLWRARQMMSTIMSLTLWSVIFTQQTTAFGYDRDAMIGYIFLVSLLQGAILATSLNGLAGEIYSGTISQLLLKPISILKYLAIYDLSDKCKNVIFIIVETAVLYLIFKPQIFIPDLRILFIFLGWIIMAIIIHFWIEILFGTLGFWSPQTWGPKFVFFMLVDATAGKLFPLDILPAWLRQTLYFTPFPYLSYAQTQLFLGRLTSEQIVQNTAGLLIWTVLLWLLGKTIWERGIRSYSAAGN